MICNITAFCVILLLANVHSNVLRCDLINPLSRESELCWRQLLYKSYPQIPQVVQEISPDIPAGIQARNAELSSALMQLYGLNKFNGKRNPDFSRDVMKYISDVSSFKENK